MEGAGNGREYRQDIKKAPKTRKRKAAKHVEDENALDYFDNYKKSKENMHMDPFNILANCAAKEFKDLEKTFPEKENQHGGGSISDTESDLLDIEFPYAVKDGKKMYKCTFSGCSKEFPSLSRMRRHYIIHTGAKPFKCLSSKCHKSFSRRDNMIQHYKGHCNHAAKK